jgi:4'-phosphopantetheinyl transferase EntD
LLSLEAQAVVRALAAVAVQADFAREQDLALLPEQIMRLPLAVAAQQAQHQEGREQAEQLMAALVLIPYLAPSHLPAVVAVEQGILVMA